PSQALRALLRLLGLRDGVQELDEGPAGGLGLLSVRAQLGEAPSPGIGMLSVVPDVPAEEQLGRELRGESDPARHDARHALAGVAIVTAEAGGAGRRGEGVPGASGAARLP